jgi:hypothetical protein
MAVNRPTDVKFKEQDVANKLQLYGIYSAFANGKVPSVSDTLDDKLGANSIEQTNRCCPQQRPGVIRSQEPVWEAFRRRPEAYG